MELNLPTVYRVIFIVLASTFAWTVFTSNIERSARISGLFVLVGITSTFQGIASGLGSRLGTESSAQEALLAGLALSLGGSIVGFILTFAAEMVLCFSFVQKPEHRHPLRRRPLGRRR